MYPYEEWDDAYEHEYDLILDYFIHDIMFN